MKNHFDAVIQGVAHDAFVTMNICESLHVSEGVVYDVKGVLPKEVIDGRL